MWGTHQLSSCSLDLKHGGVVLMLEKILDEVSARYPRHGNPRQRTLDI